MLHSFEIATDLSSDSQFKLAYFPSGWAENEWEVPDKMI